MISERPSGDDLCHVKEPEHLNALFQFKGNEFTLHDAICFSRAQILSAASVSRLVTTTHGSLPVRLFWPWIGAAMLAVRF